MIVRTRLAPNLRPCQANAIVHSPDSTAMWHWLWDGGAVAEYCELHDIEAQSFNDLHESDTDDVISTDDLRDLTSVEVTRVTIANILVRLADMVRPAGTPVSGVR